MVLKMPRKLRELIRALEAAGFVNRGGKGNHRNFVHLDCFMVGVTEKMNKLFLLNCVILLMM
jgi:predicted RNA binding protein YcfA (HicA-like mRNA interferase family)